MGGPLEGIRVLDWTLWQQGPVAAAMLGDLGAEVIKIETKVGDPGRGFVRLNELTTGLTSHNYYFENNNRNKKGISLDLRKDSGKEVLYRLVAESDVFLQNHRVGVAEAADLGYQILSKYNPMLIYANLSSFGPRGPDCDRPVVDIVGLARSGIMTAAGEPGCPPVTIQGSIVDQMGAIMGAYGVLAGLVARERTGVGQEINTSMLGSMLALQGFNVSTVLTLGQPLPRFGHKEWFNPLYNQYCCADGKWLVLGMMPADRYWPDFCKAMGIQHLQHDPRFADIAARAEHRAEFVTILDELFGSKPRDEWLKALAEADDLIFGPVNTLQESAKDPQVIANNYIVDYGHPDFGHTKMVGFPVELTKTPASIRMPAPRLGQHTEEILCDLLGYGQQEIEKLLEDGVI